MRVEDPQTRYVVYQNQPNKTAEVVQEEQVIDLKNSNASLSNIENSEENQETKNEKITFKEGLSLFGKGAWNKVKEMGSAIIKHPVKTLAVVGATTAAIAALPLIGISAAPGAAAAALVFGGIAIAKTTKDVVETVDDYKDGRYDEVREDLQDLGGDGVDLALSLPFMPKALKQVSRTMKYGTSTIGLNKELINGLKGASSVDDVVREFGNVAGFFCKDHIPVLPTCPQLAVLGDQMVQRMILRLEQILPKFVHSFPAAGFINILKKLTVGRDKFSTGNHRLPPYLKKRNLAAPVSWQ